MTPTNVSSSVKWGIQHGIVFDGANHIDFTQSKREASFHGNFEDFEK